VEPVGSPAAAVDALDRLGLRVGTAPGNGDA
jgi:hypothetical protein